MTRLEKITHLISNGHTYNPETGELPFPEAEKPVSGLNITKLEKVG